MAENAPTLEEWRRLYDAAIRVKGIAPWEWMTETDVFGVRNPEADELGFVSVMGMLGEHYSVAVYLGPKGLYDFWDFEDAGPDAPAEHLVEIPHLQASFEDRNQLHDKDRQIIKKLSLKFRGRNAWPMFRSYRPGYFPWFLEAQEARFLAVVLEQVLDVTPRFQDDRTLLEPPDHDRYLVRVSRQRRGTRFWEDRITAVPPPERQSIPLAMDVQALEQLKQVPRSRGRIEIDLFMLPAPTKDKGDSRPFFPYALMIVEAQSGVVLGTELLKPDPSLEAMWGQIPLHVVVKLARFGIVPAEVRVRSELVLQLLRPVAKELGFRLKRSDRLRRLDQAKEFLLQRFT
jgi:hypothetical protein